MVDQYAKFMYQSKEVEWRKPLSSLNYILSSLGWRQDHNWYSHQNPGFISGLLDKHWDYISIYFPVDSNSMIAVLDEIFVETDNINVVVAWKRDLRQYLTLAESKKQLKLWAWIWDFASDENPDIVFGSCWDYVTQEMLEWLNIMKTYLPEINVRYVNVCKLTALWIWTESHSLTDLEFDKLFTRDKDIIFSYHGYSQDIKKIIFWHEAAQRFYIEWYREEWSTTTPLDMMIRNWVSRYQVCINACERLLLTKKWQKSVVESKLKDLVKKLKKKLRDHRKYIIKEWIDPEDLNDLG